MAQLNPPNPPHKPDPLRALLRSRKFWLAVVACLQTILFNQIPNFPQDVWLSINAIILIVIATIAGEDIAQKLGNGKGK